MAGAPVGADAVPAPAGPRRALLVVDLQQAFVDGEHRAHDIDRVLANVNVLIDAARAAKAPVIFVQHVAPDGALGRGAPGWPIAAALRRAWDDAVVEKTASDAFHGTDLAERLSALCVQGLVVCGAQSEFCVDSTVRRALALGHEVVLVEDAHTTLDNGVLSAPQIVAHHTATLTALSSYPGRARACKAADVSFVAQEPAWH